MNCCVILISQSSLPNPVRYALQPWAVARVCDLSSLLQHLSSSAACHLLPAAALAPGPNASSLPKSECAWHRTVKTPRRLLRADIASDLSPSSVRMCPFLPLDTPATLTLQVASAATRAWVCSDTSPKFPETIPRTSPSSTSFLSTGPIVPSGIWLCFRSAPLALLTYSCGSKSALASTARLSEFDLYRVLLQLIILTSCKTPPSTVPPPPRIAPAPPAPPLIRRSLATSASATAWGAIAILRSGTRLCLCWALSNLERPSCLTNPEKRL